MAQEPRLSARRIAAAALLALTASQASLAADQTQPGAGNAAAQQLAHQSPLVQSAMRFLIAQADRIHDRPLHNATHGACVW